MINFETAVLASLVVHTVGNKTNEEPIFLANSVIENLDADTQNCIVDFFSKPFLENANEFFHFTSGSGSPQQNVVFVAVNSFFENNGTFLETSQNLSRFLYDVALHPQIKPGDLWVGHLKNIKFNDYMTPVNALAIFKNENQHPFLKHNNQQIDLHMGLNPSKVDKGCLIFDLDKTEGYQVLICDKSNKAGEAHYWKNNFLELKTTANDFNCTKNFMALTKAYIKDQFSEDFQVETTQKLDLINRSAEYFKKNESFSKTEFETEVLQDKGLIDKFQNFDETYRFNNGIEHNLDEFKISDNAVKKQMKNFKSVLKLDKNFHVYIHGNRELIEKGAEPDGRKYYKIYYTEET